MTQKTILLVEDEALIALAETETLKSFGYDVRTAHSGEESVRIFEDDDSIDLVLMDIDLGSGIDGTEAAQTMLSIKDIPVVFLSSHTEKGIVEKTEKITSYGYVVKNSGDTILETSIKMAFKLFNANQKLREKDERLQSFMDSATESFFLLDTDLNYIDVNDAALRMLKINRGDLINKNILDLSPDLKNNGRYEKYKEVITTGIPLVYSDLVPHPKFGNAHIELKAFRVGAGLGVIINDITERKKAEIELKKNESFLSTIFQNSDFGIFVVAVDQDGKFIYEMINPMHEKLLGFSKEAIEGKSPEDLEELIGIKAVDYVVDLYTQCIQGKKTIESEFYVAEGSAKGWWFSRLTPIVNEDTGQVYRLVGTSMVVSKLKETERELKKSEERLRAITDNIHDTIIQSDASGNITYINHTLPELPHEKVLSSTVFDFVPPEQRPIITAALKTVFEKGETSKYESLGPGPNGGIHTYSVTVSPIFSGDTIISAVFLARDITQRKQAEEKIERLSKFPEENPNPVLRIDSMGNILYYNNASKILLESWGYKESRKLDDKWIRIIEESLTQDIPKVVEVKIQDAVMALTFAPVIDKSFVNVYGLDITTRKKTEEKLLASLQNNRDLLRELQHRAKNSFAMISSMISLMSGSDRSDPIRVVLSDVQSRIRAVSEMYDMLNATGSYTEVSLDTYVSKIISGIPVIPTNIQLTTSFDPIIVPIKTAIPIGIIINELLTNSIKYAFPNRRSGTISLSIRKDVSGVRIEVIDNGIGITEPDSGKKSSLGLLLIRSLVSQIEGTFSMDGEDGTQCVLEFPIQANLEE